MEPRMLRMESRRSRLSMERPPFPRSNHSSSRALVWLRGPGGTRRGSWVVIFISEVICVLVVKGLVFLFHDGYDSTLYFIRLWHNIL